ncbi:MAG: hypothetical protein QNJ85_00150 [Gammaproteobacteria bacterium]|nr:hypothetical protein [Gammaproteobacteria bacterium]
MLRPMITLLISSLVLAACVQPPVVIGRPGNALDPNEVSIFYTQRPTCRFETVAELSASGYLSLQSMFSNLRRDAAALGADGVFVVYTQQTEMKEFLGTAKAIRCLSA